MLPRDCLVTDLIFKANASLDQKTLIEGLGGEDALANWKVLDPDMLGPQAEMQLSPSMPFRRRGERRLMLIDEAAGPLRESPELDEPVMVDLRAAKERLIEICNKLPVRLGRLFAFGAWGDAVVVARSGRDLRGLMLLPWVLDPQVDVSGKKRGTPLTQKEFEEKVLAYDKRLDELDDQDIIENIKGANVEQRGDWLVVDVLEEDGTWQPPKSLALEDSVAAWDRFSMIPGAPASKRRPAPPVAAAPAPAPAAPEPEPVTGPPLGVAEVGGKVLLVFPPERFDLDVAAALGKRDWDQVLRRNDQLTGSQRDRLHRDGGAFVAPLEFLSEVFVDGKPLNKPQFEKEAKALAAGGKSLEVHFPRFGPVVLVEIAGTGRFVTSLMESPSEAVALATHSVHK